MSLDCRICIPIIYKCNTTTHFLIITLKFVKCINLNSVNNKFTISGTSLLIISNYEPGISRVNSHV